MTYYFLSGHTAVPCKDVLEWARRFELADRRVALSKVGPCTVSTVFLGIDHRFCGDGPPLLFETMVFLNDALDADEMEALDIQERCSTWEEAEEQHRRVIDQVRQPGDEVTDVHSAHAEQPTYLADSAAEKR